MKPWRKSRCNSSGAPPRMTARDDLKLHCKQTPRRLWGLHSWRIIMAFRSKAIVAPTVLAGLGFLGVLSGCTVNTYPRRQAVVYTDAPPPQPVYVVPPQPQPVYVAPPEAEIYIQERPPEERIERPGPPPFAHAVWIRGHWDRRGRDWAWEPGRWVVAERPAAHWEDGHWNQTPRGWRYVPGHWD
jgi:hypothetical protein